MRIFTCVLCSTWCMGIAMKPLPLFYDFIICTLQYVIILQFLSAFFEERKQGYPIKMTALLVAIASLTLVNQLHSSLLNVLASCTLAIALCFVYFSGNKLKKMMLPFFTFAITAGIEFVVLPIFAVLSGEKPAVISGNYELRFISSIVSQIALFVILQLIARFFAGRKPTGNKSSVLLVLPAVSIMVSLVLVYFDGQLLQANITSYLLIALSCTGMLVTNIVIFYVYDRSLERYSWETKYRLLENSNRAQLEYYNRLEEHLQDIKVERHDFKNNLRIIDRLIEKNPQKAADYIHTVEGRVADKIHLIEINVNNPALSVILQEKQTVCGRNGIRFEFSIECKDLSFLNTADTCAIFENALNNAVEACERIGDASLEKFIRLHISRHNNMLMIKIENSKTSTLIESADGFETSKPNPERHGFGIISIQRVAKRYGGAVTFQTTESSFTIIIRLNFLLKM